MKKLIALLLVMAGAAMLLMGCGGKEEPGEVTSLQFKKSGEVVHTIVEDFSESYYSLEELEASVQTQMNEYNASAGADSVTLDMAETQDGVITLVMTFKKPDDYTGFYRTALFCGTVKEAFNAGYDLDITLNDVRGGNQIHKQDILEMGEKHIIVVREAIQLVPYGEILYVSDDVTLLDNGKTAVTTDGENLSYIIFK